MNRRLELLFAIFIFSLLARPSVANPNQHPNNTQTVETEKKILKKNQHIAQSNKKDSIKYSQSCTSKFLDLVRATGINQVRNVMNARHFDATKFARRLSSKYGIVLSNKQKKALKRSIDDMKADDHYLEDEHLVKFLRLMSKIDEEESIKLIDALPSYIVSAKKKKVKTKGAARVKRYFKDKYTSWKTTEEQQDLNHKLGVYLNAADSDHAFLFDELMTFSKVDSKTHSHYLQRFIEIEFSEMEIESIMQVFKKLRHKNFIIEPEEVVSFLRFTGAYGEKESAAAILELPEVLRAEIERIDFLNTKYPRLAKAKRKLVNEFKKSFTYFRPKNNKTKEHLDPYVINTEHEISVAYLLFRKRVKTKAKGNFSKLRKEHIKATGNQELTKEEVKDIKYRAYQRTLDYQNRYLSCRTTRPDAYQKEAVKSFKKFTFRTGIPLALGAYTYTHWKKYQADDERFKTEEYEQLPWYNKVSEQGSALWGDSKYKSQFLIELFGAVATTILKIKLYPKNRYSTTKKAMVHYGYFASVNTLDPLVFNKGFNAYDEEAQKVLNAAQDNPELMSKVTETMTYMDENFDFSEHLEKFERLVGKDTVEQRRELLLNESTLTEEEITDTFLFSQIFEDPTFQESLRTKMINDPEAMEIMTEVLSDYLYETTALGYIHTGDYGWDKWLYGASFGLTPIGSIKSILVGVALYQMLCMNHQSAWAWLAASTIYITDNFFFNSWFYEGRERATRMENQTLTDFVSPPLIFDNETKSPVDPLGLTEFLKRTN